MFLSKLSQLWETAVSALVELSIYFQGTIHKNLFSDIPRDFKTDTFSYDIKIYLRSDVIALKYPIRGYHQNSELLFYFFKKPNEDDELNHMYKESCLVLSVFNFCPQITIIGHDYTIITYKKRYEILAFKLDEDKPTTFNISLNLQIGRRSLGYYNKDYSDSTFTIFGYELVQLEYYCKDEENETPRSRLLFSGPKDEGPTATKL
uniref:TLDc domain-containing protein n=1 Tax=Strongyloides papillosus TaxID=174720 RepID=A0A0N5B945_STREA